MNHFSKAFIAIFSEAIWIYFVIVLFTGVEWGDPLFFPVTWWVIAGVFGYVMQFIVTIKPLHYLINIVCSIIVCSFIVIKNWQVAVPEGLITFGIFLTVAVTFIFIRSSIFFYKEPTREQMLHRFEGNIIFYIMFALIFLFNPWDVNVSFTSFHIVFLIAILLSLFGMILSLHTVEEENKNIDMEIYRVGQSRSFLSLISLILFLVVVVSFSLFMPSVRNILYIAANSGLEGLKWVYESITNLMSWLAQYITTSDDGGTLPEPIPDVSIQGEMEMEEPSFSLPLPWIIGAGAFLAIAGALSVFTKFIKNWNPKKNVRTKQNVSFNRIDMKAYWKKLVLLLNQVHTWWKAKFLRFYKEPIFYYFMQVEKWARKNGMKRKTTETEKEFTERIVKKISNLDEQLHEEELLVIVDGLRNISTDYQAAAFGGSKQTVKNDHKAFLNRLQMVRVKLKD